VHYTGVHGHWNINEVEKKPRMVASVQHKNPTTQTARRPAVTLTPIECEYLMGRWDRMSFNGYFYPEGLGNPDYSYAPAESVWRRVREHCDGVECFDNQFTSLILHYPIFVPVAGPPG
jgi:hypothetical protein